jgi:hypothetical protein
MIEVKGDQGYGLTRETARDGETGCTLGARSVATLTSFSTPAGGNGRVIRAIEIWHVVYTRTQEHVETVERTARGR